MKCLRRFHSRWAYAILVYNRKNNIQLETLRDQQHSSWKQEGNDTRDLPRVQGIGTAQHPNVTTSLVVAICLYRKKATEDSSNLGGPPHPVMVSIRNNKDYIWVGGAPKFECLADEKC